MMSTMLEYFNAHNQWDLVMLWLNGLLASGVALVLLLSSQSRHNDLTWYERVARFVLTSAYTVLAVRVWMGWYYTPVEPTHVAVNALVLILVVMVRGDVAVVVRAVRQVRAKRQEESQVRANSSAHREADTPDKH